MTLDDDHTVLARSVQDAVAFERLFDRHFTAIHRYIRARLDQLAADELAAEVFVRAFAARARYVPSTPDARAWLFSIATNLVRDEARRRGREADAGARLASQSERVVVAPELGGDPELQRALLALRDEEREVLLLFAWAELSYEEIATATATAVGTVRSRLSRARTQLQQTLTASRPQERADDRP